MWYKRILFDMCNTLRSTPFSDILDLCLHCPQSNRRTHSSINERDAENRKPTFHGSCATRTEISDVAGGACRFWKRNSGQWRWHKDATGVFQHMTDWMQYNQTSFGSSAGIAVRKTCNSVPTEENLFFRWWLKLQPWHREKMKRKMPWLISDCEGQCYTSFWLVRVDWYVYCNLTLQRYKKSATCASLWAKNFTSKNTFFELIWRLFVRANTTVEYNSPVVLNCHDINLIFKI